MPPSSAAVKSPARQQGGRAGRSGQQTTGPHAPTANLTVLSRAVLTAFVLASDAAGICGQDELAHRPGASCWPRPGSRCGRASTPGCPSGGEVVPGLQGVGMVWAEDPL